MNVTKQQLKCAIIVLFSLLAFVGVAWSQVSLPTATLNGSIQTTATELTFPNVFLSRVDYADGISFATANGPNESILGANMVISGATRTGPLTFSNASLQVRNPGDLFQYLTATLNNITFEEIYPGVYYLNLALDATVPSTLNLTNVVLKTDATHPSRYIDEIQSILGTNNLLGMKLGFFVTGDITATGTGDIFDGVLDGAAAPANQPPHAIAGVTFNQTQCLSTTCEVTLNGSESTDPDSTPTYNDIVSYEWFEDINNNGTYEPTELIANGAVAIVNLPLGYHDIALKVTDSKGATDITVITVVINPAELSFLEIDKAMVKWCVCETNENWDGQKIKIKGRLALPAGVSHQTINSVGSATIGLSSLGNVVNEPVDFTVSGNGNKWKYHAQPPLGIQRFNIDWDGAKFYYKKDNLRIKSHHFGVNTTTLEIVFVGTSAGPVTIAIGSVTVSIDANDVVTVNPSTVEVDVDHEQSKTEIEVVLPFAVASTDVINISGKINQSILVADYYKAAVGKFKVDASFNSAADPTTLNPTLTLTIGLGDQGFSGTLIITPDVWTKLTKCMWKYKAGGDD